VENSAGRPPRGPLHVADPPIMLPAMSLPAIVFAE
jgi:hypothetical protein